MPKPPFITRVKLRNYKSIAQCEVDLGPLAILVGPNGAGKSNFIDAIRMASQSLVRPLSETVRERGGFPEILHRPGASHNRFEISVGFELPGKLGRGLYEFEVNFSGDMGVEVAREICEVSYADRSNGSARYEVRAGELVSTNRPTPLPRPARDRLFLVSASNLQEFHPVYDALSAMRFYDFAPDVFRVPNLSENDPYLHTPDGHNLASVLGFIEQKSPLVFDRINRYLRAIVPGLENVDRLSIPEVNRDVIRFTHRFGDRQSRVRFTAANMSDGTLRTLAILTALLQVSMDDSPPLSGGNFPPTLIGIEEPETALHPAAAGVLWDALTDGSERTQVLVSTQSPDLLDHKDIPIDSILAVNMEAGKTDIGPIFESSRNLIIERLATPGELLRQDMLSPTDRIFHPQCPLPDSERYI